ncbi:MAG: Fur family transcriptional regulator [Desulfovibrionaceae bacterium]
MKPPETAFADYLTARSLKMTPQRRLILSTFIDAAGHLSSEELYNHVKIKDPAVGQATVYRTLKLFLDSGIAEAVDFGDGLVRYELRYGQDHHDHLICEQCGKNIEIVEPTIERLQEELARSYNFTLRRHKMYLFGLCPDCRKKS